VRELFGLLFVFVICALIASCCGAGAGLFTSASYNKDKEAWDRVLKYRVRLVTTD
jgi:hypothetical protein